MRKSLTISRTRGAARAVTPARYIEDPRELVAGTRSSCSATGPRRSPPGWRRSKRRGSASRWRCTFSATTPSAGGSRTRWSRGRPAGVEVRLLYDFVGCRDTPADVLRRACARRRARDRLPPLPLLAAALLGADPAQPPQDAGVRRPDRLRGRAQHRQRWVGAGRGRRRLARRRRPGRRAGGRRHRGGLPAHLEPARQEAGAPRSRPARRRRPPAGDTALAVVSNSELRDRFAIRRAALHAIRESRDAIYLANPYFVPDRGVLRALQRRGPRAASTSACCCRRRATRRVLDLAARAVFGPLLAAGVRIWQQPRPSSTPRRWPSTTSSSRSAATTSITARSPTTSSWWSTSSTRGTRPTWSRCWRPTWPASEELTRERFGGRSLFARLLERLAYASVSGCDRARPGPPSIPSRQFGDLAAAAAADSRGWSLKSRAPSAGSNRALQA